MSSVPWNAARAKSNERESWWQFGQVKLPEIAPSKHSPHFAHIGSVTSRKLSWQGSQILQPFSSLQSHLWQVDG